MKIMTLKTAQITNPTVQPAVSTSISPAAKPMNIVKDYKPFSLRDFSARGIYLWWEDLQQLKRVYDSNKGNKDGFIQAAKADVPSVELIRSFTPQLLSTIFDIMTQKESAYANANQPVAG